MVGGIRKHPPLAGAGREVHASNPPGVTPTPKQGPYSGQCFLDFFAFFAILVVFARPATGVGVSIVKVIFQSEAGSTFACAMPVPLRYPAR